MGQRLWMSGKKQYSISWEEGTDFPSWNLGHPVNDLLLGKEFKQNTAVVGSCFLSFS